jgi:hypothetical protein
MPGDRLHAGDAGARLGVRVVVRVGVDVVGEGSAPRVDDDLDAGDADAVLSHECVPQVHQST